MNLEQIDIPTCVLSAFFSKIRSEIVHTSEIVFLEEFTIFIYLFMAVSTK